MIVKMISPNETRQKATPIKAANASGAVVKEVIPSREYIKSFQKDHFVSPFLRSTFSNSIHFVLKPTKP